MATISYFMNRRRDLVKLLYWDRAASRCGRSGWNAAGLRCRAERAPEVDRAALALLLEGVQVRVLFRSPRWKIEKR